MNLKFTKGEVLKNGTIKEHIALELFKKNWIKKGKSFGDLIMKKSVRLNIKLIK